MTLLAADSSAPIPDAATKIIETLSPRVPRMKAQYFISEYCRTSETDILAFSPDDLCHFILHFGKSRDEFKDISDQQFIGLLNSLVNLQKRVNSGKWACEDKTVGHWGRRKRTTDKSLGYESVNKNKAHIKRRGEKYANIGGTL